MRIVEKRVAGALVHFDLVFPLVLIERSAKHLDLRPGGAWRYVWSGPDDAELEMHGVYREITPPERLVSTESWGEDWPEMLNTLILTEEDGKTTATGVRGLTYDWMRYDSQKAHPRKHDVAVIYLDRPINLSSYPQLASGKVAAGAEAGQVVERRPLVLGGPVVPQLAIGFEVFVHRAHPPGRPQTSRADQPARPQLGLGAQLLPLLWPFGEREQTAADRVAGGLVARGEEHLAAGHRRCRTDVTDDIVEVRQTIFVRVGDALRLHQWVVGQPHHAARHPRRPADEVESLMEIFGVRPPEVIQRLSLFARTNASMASRLLRLASSR